MNCGRFINVGTVLQDDVGCDGDDDCGGVGTDDDGGGTVDDDGTVNDDGTVDGDGTGCVSLGGVVGVRCRNKSSASRSYSISLMKSWKLGSGIDGNRNGDAVMRGSA